jgi:hypothetical protein
MALSSIKLQLEGSGDPQDQHSLDNLMNVYLASHGQHVDSISLEAYPCSVRQLPLDVTKLKQLKAENLYLQLQPSDRYQGVLGAISASPMKQLQLHHCTFDVGAEGLAAALALLPDLEHLTIAHCYEGDKAYLRIPLRAVLPGLSKLTYLQLAPAQCATILASPLLSCSSWQR